MNKKTLIILLSVILIFSLNTFAYDLPDSPEEFLKLAKEISEEQPEHALPFYTFAYIFSNDNKEKNEIEDKIIKLRKEQDDQRGYGFNKDKNIAIEFLLLSEKGKGNYGIKNYNGYKMIVQNYSDKDIKFNSIMTKITALPKSGVQIEAVDALSIMNLDIPLDKLNKLQNSLPANQKIYSGSAAEMIVVFKKEFTPKKIIVDDIIYGDSIDRFRVDVLFIGL